MNKYIITDNRGYLEIGEAVCVITTGIEETTKKGSDTKDKEANKIERVICIPDSGGHTLDLQRVQYISPLEKGGYKVTLVSGWDLPLTDKVYSRQTLIEKWKALQNKTKG